MATAVPENLIIFDPSSMTVQELAKNPPPSLPQCYLREDQNIPDAQPESLPIIDMNRFLSEEHREAELKKLDSACREWGIFQLVNHGVSEEELEKVRNGVEGFFSLPPQEKMKYKIRPGDIEGYGSAIRSQAEKQDWCDRFYMTINPIHKRKPYLYPELPPSFRTVLDMYIEKAQNIGMTLVGLLEKALKMEEREMKEVNGVSGLQVDKNGVWVPVNILPNSLVVNVGDILEIISNGVYKSPVHRATVNTGKERISMVLFFVAKLDAEIGPAKSLISPENPPLYKTLEAEKYFNDYFSLKQQGRSL
ncbi:hypothetical protein K1719_002228 [Acacia pycnantha]|nr:hypothetical protein K1719_002228 [Acacia pycnantha]